VKQPAFIAKLVDSNFKENIMEVSWKKAVSGAVLGLKGNPVKFGNGPGAVIGDETRSEPLIHARMGKARGID